MSTEAQAAARRARAVAARPTVRYQEHGGSGTFNGKPNEDRGYVFTRIMLEVGAL